jgi:hypothetical protein
LTKHVYCGAIVGVELGELSVFVGVSGEHISTVSIGGDTRSMMVGEFVIVPIDFVVGV